MRVVEAASQVTGKEGGFGGLALDSHVTLRSLQTPEEVRVTKQTLVSHTADLSHTVAERSERSFCYFVCSFFDWLGAFKD